MPMDTELLIDGYNLLHHAGLRVGRLQKRTGSSPFEQARDRLLKRLKDSLTEAERALTTIVFDAQHAEHVDRRPTIQFSMQVLFSAKGRQADDLIEEILCAHQQPRRVRIVSSDQRLRIAARAVGAASIDSDSFLVELDERRADRGADRGRVSDIHDAPPRNQSPPLTAEDWLKEFGDIDVSELEADTRPTRQVSSPSQPPESPARSDLPVNKTVPPPDATDKRNPSGQITSRPTAPNGADVAPEKPPLPDSELAFWEARVADILNKDHSSQWNNTSRRPSREND